MPVKILPSKLLVLGELYIVVKGYSSEGLFTITAAVANPISTVRKIIAKERDNVK